MGRYANDCTVYNGSPFTFWTMRPGGKNVGRMGCADCDVQDVDWTRADADEVHKAAGGATAVGTSGAFSARDYVRGLAINYLLTDAEATHHPECVELIARRGWWADDWRPDGFRLGSRLWTLQWSAAINETLVKAREYALEALQPLVALKVARSVDVAARYVGSGRLMLDVTITGPWGAVDFQLSGAENPPYGFLWREVENG